MGQNEPTGRQGLVGRALGSVRDSKRRVCACVSVSVWCVEICVEAQPQERVLLLLLLLLLLLGESAAGKEINLLPRTFSLAPGGAAR
jgi:hypothetical protein